MRRALVPMFACLLLIAGPAASAKDADPVDDTDEAPEIKPEKNNKPDKVPKVGKVDGHDVDQADLAPHTHGPDGLKLDKRNKAGLVPGLPYEVDSQVPWATADFPLPPVTVDRPDAVDLAALPQVHAIYVHPKDKPSRLAAFAAMFQADARQASGRLTSWYGRGVRFDEVIASNVRYLDISVLKSSYSNKTLGGSGQFSRVANELKARGFTNQNKKYVVWLDAPSKYCGQGELYHDSRRSSANYNNLRTTAIVYRPYTANLNDGVTGGFCRGRTLLHELGHNMGALQPTAPSAFDGAHCDDDDNDVMCYTSAATTASPGTGKFDHNNDDYWDPVAAPALGSGVKLPWWTVNLSRFVCPPPGDCRQPNITTEY